MSSASRLKFRARPDHKLWQCSGRCRVVIHHRRRGNTGVPQFWRCEAAVPDEFCRVDRWVCISNDKRRNLCRFNLSNQGSGRNIAAQSVSRKRLSFLSLFDLGDEQYHSLACPYPSLCCPNAAVSQASRLPLPWQNPRRGRWLKLRLSRLTRSWSRRCKSMAADHQALARPIRDQKRDDADLFFSTRGERRAIVLRSARRIVLLLRSRAASP